MALTVREAEQMLEVAERSRGLARIDHELRYEPNRRKVRQLIQVGTIGPILHLELVLRPYVRADRRPQALDAPSGWRSDAGSAGGILGAGGSHLSVLCRRSNGSELLQRR